MSNLARGKGQDDLSYGRFSNFPTPKSGVKTLILKIIFKCISFAETLCAYLQGKGYGAASIKQEIQLALKLLDKSPTLIIDIGGSLGNYTQECLDHFPNAEIHIFEPSAKSAAALKTRFRNIQHVHVIPSAVSDVSGSSVLFANDSGSALSSLTKRRLDHFNLPFDFQETVTTVKFEDYWSTQLQKRPIDLACSRPEMMPQDGQHEQKRARRKRLNHVLSQQCQPSINHVPREPRGGFGVPYPALQRYKRPRPDMVCRCCRRRLFAKQRRAA